jgi:hypothetical protein
MSGLTVTEKSHWKERIARRIDKRIETIAAANPGLLDRAKREGRERAEQSLGLAELRAELDEIEKSREALDRRQRRARCAMLAIVRSVAVEDVEHEFHGRHEHHEVQAAVERRAAVHEDELLAESELGRQILKLRIEKENLLDTIWLAVSPAQIKQLWSRVTTLLGDELTELEQEALAIAPTRPTGDD